jgi:hypothetical protein
MHIPLIIKEHSFQTTNTHHEGIFLLNASTIDAHHEGTFLPNASNAHPSHHEGTFLSNASTTDAHHEGTFLLNASTIDAHPLIMKEHSFQTRLQ